MRVMYKEKKLERLNKEMRKYTYDCKTLDFSFIDTKEKNYEIIENKDNKKYALYEYCILLKKYKYIKHYCHHILKSTYSIDKYFEYCKMGNIEAVYFCILEGIDPEKRNEKDRGINALTYACQKNNIKMLQMLIDNF